MYLRPRGRSGGNCCSFGLRFWFLFSGNTWFNLTFQPWLGIITKNGILINAIPRYKKCSTGSSLTYTTLITNFNSVWYLDPMNLSHGNGTLASDR